MTKRQARCLVGIMLLGTAILGGGFVSTLQHDHGWSGNVTLAIGCAVLAWLVFTVMTPALILAEAATKEGS